MKQTLTIILLMLSFLSLCVCGGIIYLDYREQAAADVAAEETSNMKPALPEPQEGSPDLPIMDFTELKAGNPDVVAWLTLPDTKIDYPVVQGEDNAYYLNHDAKKRPNKNGAIFLDYRAHADFSDFNSVIHGHHMKSGAMFQNLVKFKEKAFWDSHTSAILYTPGYTYSLEIIAVAVVRHDSPLFQYAFASPAEKTAHLDEIRGSAKFYRDVGITGDDRIVTLSTCSYEFKNARTMVIAKITCSNIL